MDYFAQWVMFCAGVGFYYALRRPLADHSRAGNIGNRLGALLVFTIIGAAIGAATGWFATLLMPLFR